MFDYCLLVSKKRVFRHNLGGTFCIGDNLYKGKKYVTVRAASLRKYMTLKGLKIAVKRYVRYRRIFLILKE